MRAIDLALKDWTQLVRDGKTALFLLILPIVFTLMFGFAFGGFEAGEADERLPVGILDEDGSQLSQQLVDALGASAVVRFEARRGADRVGLEREVREGKLAAGVVVPAAYGEGLLAGKVLRLAVIAKPDAAGQAALEEIQAAVARLVGAVEAARLSLRLYEDQARMFPNSVTALEAEEQRAFLLEGAGAAVSAWKDSPPQLEVSEAQPASEEEAGMAQSGFSHTSPSMMVQFAIAGLVGAASLLVGERKSRTLRRLLTTPMRRREIIAGHYLAMFTLILAQLVVLAAFGQIALGVPYLREPLATALVMLATAAWTASLGLLIGALAKSDEQVILFSLIPMFVLAGMGGAWVPLEFTGKAFSAIGHALPSAWAMDGFENIVIRGLGLESAWLPAGVMLAYAVGLFAVAAWRFRTE